MAARGSRGRASRPWRPFLVAWSFACGAWLLAGCASIEGLTEFGGGDDASGDAASTGAVRSTDATAVGPAGDDDTADSDTETGTETEPAEDADDEVSFADAPSGETGQRDSGSTAYRDAGVSDDRDAGSDAAPTCDSVSCGGCCTTSGLCASGGLSSACGSAGSACEDCTTTGQACVDNVCSAPPVDAGPPPTGCEPSTCANLCVPYFVQCCKSDSTCGCSLFFPPGPCN
jgi:hypothetical protein